LATPERPNVVLIVVDTLRYDRSDALKAAFEGFHDYGWAVTPAPWTLPAHVSLLTGLYPSLHGSHETEALKWRDIQAIRNRAPTLMTRLKGLGYSTYGFSANSFISKEFGFTGFDLLTNWDSNPVLPIIQLLDSMDPRGAQLLKSFLDTRTREDLGRLVAHLIRQDPRMLSRLLTEVGRVAFASARGEFVEGKGAKQATQFLKATRFREPYFLFMNVLDVHEPYLRDDVLFGKGQPIVSADSVPKSSLSAWVGAYDSQARRLPGVISGYLKILEARGLLDESLIIITSDHGQLLGEHGWAGHGVFLFDELVKVPLLVKYPAGMKIPPSDGKGRISLTSIPRFVLDVVQGKATDAGLFSPQVFSESWGTYETVGGDAVETVRRYHLGDRRTCLYTDSGKVAYNLTTGTVEEAQLNGSHDQSQVDRMAQECVKFGLLNERLKAVLR
jgi:arylsulfatase A-like enzyme